MTTLDQEKFNTVKEIAALHEAVSSANVDLMKLKEETEKYLVTREQEAEERVIKVLKESRDALEETSKNHNELSGFSRDLKAYAIELKVLATDISALFKNFNTRMGEANTDMEINQKIVSELLKKIKIERVEVQEDRKLLVAERAEIDEQHRLLKDKREVLERAWAELKRLQTNKKEI